MKQRDAFLKSEGDAWFERNTGRTGWQFDPQADPLLGELRKLPAPATGTPMRLLEIGCGGGARLAWLRDHLRFECCGIDPSARAVAVAQTQGLDVRRGTADALPFADASFDLVVFGFCLYLCDREDLFRVATEADRVLRDPGWLVLLDFHARHSSLRSYEHRDGVFTHKMDFTQLFSWHPAYSVYSQRLSAHGTSAYTDDAQDWTALSVLRKKLPAGSAGR